MVMPLCGTFQYAGVIPVDWSPPGRFWSPPGRLRLDDQSGAASAGSGDPLFENRLVGLQPVLEISTNQLVLKASGRNRAEVSSAALEIDPVLIGVFRVGDALNLCRTGTADIGVSLLRFGQLIFAVGAVTVTPLGDTVAVRGGPEVVNSAPYLLEWPRRDTWVDVSISGEASRLRGGEEATIRDYKVSVLRCFQDGFPGKFDCLAISLEGICPHQAAAHSAKLLGRPNAGLTMTAWSGGVIRSAMRRIWGNAV